MDAPGYHIRAAAPVQHFELRERGNSPKNLQGPSVRNPGEQFDREYETERNLRSGERTAKLDVRLGSCRREPYMGLLFLVADIVDADCLA
jgi:hypothetical protein